MRARPAAASVWLLCTTRFFMRMHARVLYGERRWRLLGVLFCIVSVRRGCWCCCRCCCWWCRNRAAEEAIEAHNVYAFV